MWNNVHENPGWKHTHLSYIWIQPGVSVGHPMPGFSPTHTFVLYQNSFLKVSPDIHGFFNTEPLTSHRGEPCRNGENSTGQSAVCVGPGRNVRDTTPAVDYREKTHRDLGLPAELSWKSWTEPDPDALVKKDFLLHDEESVTAEFYWSLKRVRTAVFTVCPASYY